MDDITIRRLVQSILVVLMVHDRRANMQKEDVHTCNDYNGNNTLLCNTSMVSNTSSTNTIITTPPTSNYKESNNNMNNNVNNNSSLHVK